MMNCELLKRIFGIIPIVVVANFTTKMSIKKPSTWLGGLFIYLVAHRFL